MASSTLLSGSTKITSRGMISVGDLVKSKIDEQSFMIDQLERYIKGETAGVAH